jgi:prephenate dehydrogenase
MADPELTNLREEIASLDRELLAALNRRLDLVRRVAEHKAETGAPAIDAQREAELLAQLVAANRGPLSEQGVRTAFSALLDVLKQELRTSRAPTEAAAGPRKAAVSSLAVIGTGLVGTSIARAAQRSGVARVTGWDADQRTLAESNVQAAASLAEAVRDVELVVVAVPVGALRAAVLQTLDTVAPETTVTDVGSTKRGVAAIDDARFVPGHPLAGGSTGGPTRAAADLFDGATWILSPTPSSGAEHVARMRAFAESLGAHVTELDAQTHDRMLALTSHLPHAIANLLVQSVGDAGAYAGPAFREMTRVAGANAAIWADIFLENADELASALAAHAGSARDVVNALRERDRAFLERWIGDAAKTRAKLDEQAYRTDARQLHRIRVRVPDKPGVLARITQTLGAAGVNIEDFELRHVSPEYGGVLVVLVAGSENLELARTLLRREGYSAA